MYLLPAIDLLDGRAVRLAKGDYHAVTVYSDDPAYQAQLFEEAGATWLHVVDLDGAKSGNPDNLEVVRAILARTSLKVEVGGGVRSLEAADRLLDAGATRVILGTALVRDPDFAQAAMEKFGPDALVAGIDAKAGEAAVATYYAGDYLSMLENNEDLVYVVPEEGSNWFVDAMCVLKSSQHMSEAEEWINFIASTKANLANMDYIWYASPNGEALEEYPAYYEEVNEEPLDPEIYEVMAPSEEVLHRCEIYENLPTETLRLYDRLWTRLGV